MLLSEAKMLGGGVSFFSHCCFAHVLENQLLSMLTLATVNERSDHQTKPMPSKYRRGHAGKRKDSVIEEEVRGQWG